MQERNKTPWIDQEGHYSYAPMRGYNAFINFVVGARDIGKTFTRRKDTITYCIKNGLNFADVSRYKDDLSGSDSVQAGYFDKLAPFFPDHVFKTVGVHGYYANRSDMDEKGKIPNGKWRHLVYFIALNDSSKLKERTFINISDVIFDEFIITEDAYHHYLPDEAGKFWEMLKSLDRANPDGTHLKITVWMLANACNIANPYFTMFGLTTPPEYGYKWLDKELGVLLHYVPPFERKKRNMSRTEKLISKYDKNAAMVFENKFINGGDLFISDKPSTAKFLYAMSLYGEDFGIWYDSKSANIYINERIPKNTRYNFVLSLIDLENDAIAIQRTSDYCKQLSNMAMHGRLYYSSPAVREKFKKILKFLGVR